MAGKPPLRLFMPQLNVLGRRLILLCFLSVFSLWLLDAVVPVDLTPRPGSRLVLAVNGQPLRAFADENGVWRYPVTVDDVSPNYLQALIGYEDRFFYQHPGVNPLAMMRALAQAVRYGEVVSGGSTITMQVARMRYPEPRTLLGKLKEMFRALQIDWHYSKSDILNYYLNHAPFGGTIEGVQAAALTYLGYDARHLTDAQAALLAVLPQAPTRFRPDLHPAVAERARNKVLDRLGDFQIWTEQRVVDAKLETVIALPRESFQSAPLLSRRLVQQHDSDVISTFIEAGWQGQVSRRVRDYVSTISDQVSAAVLIMDNRTGAVPVYIGSSHFGDTQRDGHVDMVSAIRSPGSALKPFIYALAMDEGLIHSESLLMDVPLRFDDFQPDNFNGGFSGAVAVSEALQTSLNVPAVQVLDQLGAAKLYLSLQKSGARFVLPEGGRPNLAIALGGLGTNLESLVTLFSALDRQGATIRPRYTPTDAQIVTPLLSEGSAWIVRKILADSARAPSGIALKTGTSFGFRDSWAVAVVDGYTIGVWVGRPDGAPVTGHFGQRTAVPLLLNAIMPVIQNNRLPPKPTSVTAESICWPTGQPETDLLCDERRDAWVLDRTIPSSWMQIEPDAGDYRAAHLTLTLAADSGLQVPFGCMLPTTSKSVAVWPLPLNAWRPPAQRLQSRIPPFDDRCDAQLRTSSPLPLSLAGIRSGDSIVADPSQPVQVSLWAEGGQPPYFWYLNGRLQATQGERFSFFPESQHRYEIVLMDYHGLTDRQQIEAR